jgi:hypothetical protein
VGLSGSVGRKDNGLLIRCEGGRQEIQMMVY